MDGFWNILFLSVVWSWEISGQKYIKIGLVTDRQDLSPLMTINPQYRLKSALWQSGSDIGNQGGHKSVYA